MSEKVEKAVSNIINHVKKSPVLNAAKELFEKAIDQTENLQHEPISLDELVSGLSDNTDIEILKIQQQENICFIGGELLVSGKAQQNGFFSLDLKLYFQDKMENIILKEKHKELDVLILNEVSKNELFQQGIIKFEINEPDIQG